VIPGVPRGHGYDGGTGGGQAQRHVGPTVDVGGWESVAVGLQLDVRELGAVDVEQVGEAHERPVMLSGSADDLRPASGPGFRSPDLAQSAAFDQGDSISMQMLPALREPACTACAGPVVIVAWTQLCLLRHGGYGEAQRTSSERCITPGCGSVRRVAVDSVDPRVAASA